MRFMIQVRANKDTEAGVMPSKEMIDAMDRFNQELIKDGVLLAADGLHDSSKGARIRWSGGKPRVIDGPFAEAKEMIAGYWLIQAKSKQEVIERFLRCPPPADGGTNELEIRQVFDPSDFPPELLSPEIRAREEGWIEGQKRAAPRQSS
jgi:hypothetical protein